MPAKATISLNDRFGKLVVVALSDQRIKGEYVWECLCDCGNTIYRASSKVRLGGGCRCMMGRAIKHGMEGTPEFTAYWAMRTRCYDIKADSYKHYGGRGIRVYAEWLGSNGFELFFAHVGLRPSPKHSLDRYPNKDGNYEPGNVRWASPEEQQRNRRNNRLFTLDGVTRTQVEWVEITGFSELTLAYRRKKGWTDKQILTTPLNARQPVAD